MKTTGEVNMTAYVIAQLNVTDAKGFEAYREAVPPVIAAHGGRYLVRGGDLTELEGTAPRPRVVVVEFPDRPAAEAFYNSADYQAILPLRLNSAEGPVVIVDGAV